MKALNGLNYYENSQCSSNGTIQVTVDSNSQPTALDKPFVFYTLSPIVEFELAPMYQTNVTVHCANYYKQ